MEINDNELTVRLQQNDTEAFNALYWRYHQGLYANIFKLIKDADAAKDILQEVFIILWEKRQTIDASRSVSSWLFVVSYNKSIDYLKKKLKESVSYDEIEAIMEHVEEENVSLKETQQALLEKAVQQLSPQKRRVFELCKIQRKTYEQTANELQISKNTVKEYLSSAIVNIREYLRDHPDLLVVFIQTFLLSVMFCGVTEY